MNTRKKGPLTPEEHAVCEGVAQLRRKMGLSQGMMARQVETTTRSISRWERCLCVPQQRHLARLEQLQRMVDDPAEQGRIVRFDDRRRRPKRPPGTLNLTKLKEFARPVIGALLAKLGGKIVLTKAELLSKTAKLWVWRNPADASFTLEMDEGVALRLCGGIQQAYFRAMEGRPSAIGETQAETPARQIDRLARFIMENIPGEPSRSEGAVDTAIRLLRLRGDTNQDSETEAQVVKESGTKEMDDGTA